MSCQLKLVEQCIEIVDETGEDYLYSRVEFEVIEE